MGDMQQGSRRGGRFGKLLGLAAIAGAGALWRQRQRQRDLDEELWGDPREFDRSSTAPADPITDAAADED